MSQIRLTYDVFGGDFARAGEASASMRLALKKLGLPPDLIRRASVCMYEGEINMVIHANGGTAEVLVDLDSVTIRLADTGPGIADVDQAMEEGFSTASEAVRELGFGAGMGLPNMKRSSDEMLVETVLGKGTTVTMKLYIDGRNRGGEESAS
jgi:serine/threonine-protein kinase RsbT